MTGKSLDAVLHKAPPAPNVLHRRIAEGTLSAEDGKGGSSGNLEEHINNLHADVELARRATRRFARRSSRECCPNAAHSSAIWARCRLSIPDNLLTGGDNEKCQERPHQPGWRLPLEQPQETDYTASIKSQVLAKIGKPPRLDHVEVSRHHGGNYRVNIWEQPEPNPDHRQVGPASGYRIT